MTWAKRPGSLTGSKVPADRRLGHGTDGQFDAYKNKLETIKPQANMIESAPVRLLHLAEKGQIQNTAQIRVLIDEYLQPFEALEMDSLIFSCTDLTCVRQETVEALGDAVSIIDPAEEVVIESKDWLSARDCLNQQQPSKRKYRICVTGNGTKYFSVFTREFLGLESSSVEQVIVS